MKKLLTLTLSLLMAFSLCLTISADTSDVAEIGENKYSTLQAAINAAKENDVIYLIANTSENITVAGDKNITLVINNGVTLTNNGDHTIVNSGTLTITGGGTIDNVTHGRGDIVNNYGATVTLQGGVKYTRSQEAGTSKDSSGGNSWYNIQNYGTMTIKGNTSIISSGSFSSLIRNGEGKINEYATLTIEAGNFSGGVNTVKNAEFGILCVKGGSFSNTTQATLLNWGEAEISNGIFSPTSNATNAVITGKWVQGTSYTSKGSTKISGGTFNGTISLWGIPKEEKGNYGKPGKTTISGGTFLSDVSEYLASDYNVAKIDNLYKVVKKNAEVEVDTITPAVDENAYSTATNSATDKDGNKVEITSSTEIVMTASDDIEDTKKEEAIAKAKDVLSTSTKTDYLPLNIELKAITGESSTNITNLDSDITVTLYLDETTLSKLSGKDIKVVRIHTENGEEKVDALPATLTNNALTFKTNKFSTYVIAYSEKASPTKSYSSKDKNQDGVISCEEEMDSANWIWSTTKNACVYKVSNTGVR